MPRKGSPSSWEPEKGADIGKGGVEARVGSSPVPSPADAPPTCVPQGSLGAPDLHPRRWPEAEGWSRWREVETDRIGGLAGWLPQGSPQLDSLKVSCE